MGFPTKNDNFGVFWGYPYFWKPPNKIRRFFDLVCLDGKSFHRTYSPKMIDFKSMMNERMVHTWYPKQTFFHGCFSFMIPNLYIKNGFTISIH